MVVVVMMESVFMEMGDVPSKLQRPPGSCAPSRGQELASRRPPNPAILSLAILVICSISPQTLQLRVLIFLSNLFHQPTIHQAQSPKP
jgi:hypothetical protein